MVQGGAQCQLVTVVEFDPPSSNAAHIPVAMKVLCEGTADAGPVLAGDDGQRWVGADVTNVVIVVR